ncbi:hypothetical protein BWD09_00350 [Neisseria dentiae]|uniref:Uncharacterized protein n=1 Tax=Neisseria dentiae TaxID=194197 RepID=A0A1X3DGB3_9NEIS|nr:hypothetical protein BWD09_00350 [Neisseria dentiae]
MPLKSLEDIFAKASAHENTCVMPGLDPGIFLFQKKYQILGSSPSMTTVGYFRRPALRPSEILKTRH